MGFFSPAGVLRDVTGSVQVCAISNVQVHDPIGAGMRTCSFVPSIEFAMADHSGPDPFTVRASGAVFRVHLTKWGMANGLPHAEGFVV